MYFCRLPALVPRPRVAAAGQPRGGRSQHRVRLQRRGGQDRVERGITYRRSVCAGAGEVRPGDLQRHPAGGVQAAAAGRHREPGGAGVPRRHRGGGLLSRGHQVTACILS